MPPGAEGEPWNLAVAQVGLGALQIWVNYAGPGASAQHTLWSQVLTNAAELTESLSVQEEWTAWEPFDLKDDPGFLLSPCGVMLDNGETRLWALGSAQQDPARPQPGQFAPKTVYTATRGAGPGAPGAAGPGASATSQVIRGWSKWEPFTVLDGDAFPRAVSLQACGDGANRAYLLALTGEQGVYDTVQYTYLPTGSAQWTDVKPLPPMPPVSISDPARVLSAAALPEATSRSSTSRRAYPAWEISRRTRRPQRLRKARRPRRTGLAGRASPSRCDGAGAFSAAVRRRHPFAELSRRVRYQRAKSSARTRVRPRRRRPSVRSPSSALRVCPGVLDNDLGPDFGRSYPALTITYGYQPEDNYRMVYPGTIGVVPRSEQRRFGAQASA